MPRARWWVIGALAVLTLTVVLLDATGVIFEETGPVVPAAVDVPAPPPAGEAVPAAVQPSPASPEPSITRRVDRLLDDPGLGGSVHAVVATLAAPDSAWTEVAPDAAAIPASNLKLWTATAVLDAFGPADRITTSVAWDEGSRTLVLVGGGDATLQTDRGLFPGAASLSSLARRVAAELTSQPAGDEPLTLDYDTSLFTGPAVSPAWEPTYVTSGVIAPVTALMVDQGMVDPPSLARYPDPALATAETFADLLSERGVEVASRHRSVDVDDLTDATQLASVQSPQIDALVEQMLRTSDNQLAEALGRLAAGAEGLPLSFKGAAQVIEQSAQAAGVDTAAVTVLDASGLSRDDRFTASGLLQALADAAADPQLAPVLSGLAVAGFDGTLADRFQSGGSASAAGLVRAKTGTLTGVSAEAGVATSCEGDLIGFVVVADEVVDTETARAVIDDVAAALTSCS